MLVKKLVTREKVGGPHSWLHSGARRGSSPWGSPQPLDPLATFLTFQTCHSRRQDIVRCLQEANLRFLCEVGVHRGVNFRRLLKSDPILLIGIDRWAADGDRSQNDQKNSQQEFDRFYEDLLTLAQTDPKDRLWIMRADSLTGATNLKMSMELHETICPSWGLDYIYIDADHTYQACLDDLRAYWPIVRVGGVLGGHDYVDSQAGGAKYGVIPAVQEFIRKERLQDWICFTQKETHASYFIVKP